MERSRDMAAELRALKRALPDNPWLFARYAARLAAAGRARDALSAARKGVLEHPDYLAGWTVLADLLDADGEAAEAERIRERICQLAPGPHAAWSQRVKAARGDDDRHRELVRQAWELDAFSAQRNQEMEQAGLRPSAEYEPALRPTAAEAARREEQFRRLLDTHAGGGAQAPVEDGSAAPTPEVDPPDAPAVVQPLPEPEEVGAEGDAEGLETAEPPAQGAIPPKNNGREHVLAQQAERLATLTRPLNLHLRLPAGRTEDPSRKVAGRPADLFDPRSMMTRRLAGIYLEQGYPGLAIRVLEALQEREPASPDLPSLLEAARLEEARLAESAGTRPRRPRGA